jgi:hypothetical protein
MDPEIGADIVFGNLSEKERKKQVGKMMADSSPYPAARVYGIQDVIHPCETRDYLINVLRIIRDSLNKGVANIFLHYPQRCLFIVNARSAQIQNMEMAIEK